MASGISLQSRWLFSFFGVFMAYVFICDVFGWGMQPSVIAIGIITVIYLSFGLALEYFLRRVPLLVSCVTLLSAAFWLWLFPFAVLEPNVLHAIEIALAALAWFYLFFTTRRLTATLRAHS